MNERQLFLHLFHQSLHPEESIEEMDVSEADWKMIFRLSEAHHVVPLIYEQVNTTALRERVDESLLSIWRQKTIHYVLRQEYASRVFLDLYEQMCRSGITPLVVKGIVIRQLYRNPDYRMSTDEDLWIPEEQMRACEQFLRLKGYEKHPGSGKEEVSYTHGETGLHLELHTVPFATDCGYENMNEAFSHCYENRKQLEIDGVTVYTLDETDHFMYLIGHCYQHFMCCGVGVRQLGDLMLWKERFGTVIDWERVETFTEKNHLVSFLNILEKVMESFRNPEKQESLLPFIEDMISGGVYGKSSRERIYSSTVLHTELTGKGGSLPARLWGAVFVPRKTLEKKYIWLKRAPYLLPAAWIIRLWEYRTKNRTNRQLTVKALKTGEHRLKLAKQYGFL